MDQQIVLRPIVDENVAQIRTWLFQEHVAKWFEHPLDWLSEIEGRHKKYHWIHHFMASYDGTDIGFCQYYAYSNGGEDWHGTIDVNGSYSLDYLIGEAEYMGCGLGKGIIKSLLSEISKEPDAKRVLAKPDPQNAASCNTLLSAGFQYDADNHLYFFLFRHQ